MANKLTIKLTPDQQKQIQDATGKATSELSLSWAAADELTEEGLAQVTGGAGDTPTESVSLNFTKITF